MIMKKAKGNILQSKESSETPRSSRLSFLLLVRVQSDDGRLELSRRDLLLKHDIKLSERTLDCQTGAKSEK